MHIEETKSNKPKVAKTDFNFALSSWYSATYFIIAFWIPSKEKFSTTFKKALKLPTYAMPFAPTKSANALEVMKPKINFNKICTLFKEVILNKGCWIIFLISDN